MTSITESLTCIRDNECRCCLRGLYFRYGDKIMNFVETRLGRSLDAQDADQFLHEAMLGLKTTVSGFDEKDDAEAWLFRHVRLQMDENNLILVRRDSESADQLETHLMPDIISEELINMTPLQRSVFFLLIVEDYTLEQASLIENVSIDIVRQALIDSCEQVGAVIQP